MGRYAELRMVIDNKNGVAYCGIAINVDLARDIVRGGFQTY